MNNADSEAIASRLDLLFKSCATKSHPEQRMIVNFILFDNC